MSDSQSHDSRQLLADSPSLTMLKGSLLTSSLHILRGRWKKCISLAAKQWLTLSGLSIFFNKTLSESKGFSFVILSSKTLWTVPSTKQVVLQSTPRGTKDACRISAQVREKYKTLLCGNIFKKNFRIKPRRLHSYFLCKACLKPLEVFI